MKNINIKFPLVDDPEKNNFWGLNTITKDALKSNLLFLLMTEKGEKYYDPEFGTNLSRFIFEPNDQVTDSDIQKDINNSVRNYIPQLTITRVKSTANEHDLIIDIGFSYDEGVFSDSGSIQITF